MKEHVVIIGAGHAGVQAAASLRDEGFDGSIALLDSQKHWPYQRPPLSKAFLKGETSQERIVLRSEQFFHDARIDLEAGVHVEEILPNDQKVKLRTGKVISYQTLILATGARAREVSTEGKDLAGVYSLRNLKDAETLKQSLDTAQDVVVIGAGFIGLEFAATAAAKGANVTVVEMQPRVMSRAISSAMSAAFLRKHKSIGVHFKLGLGVQHFFGRNGHVTAVELTDGQQIKCELVVLGIGVLAKDRLAVQAGLAVNNGILVDGELRSSVGNIFAIGDNNAHPNHYFGERLRLESVQNAVDQAKHVASIITGKSHPYRSLPWFWSDQGDYKLQIAGVAKEITQHVVRGDAESSSFSILGFNGKQLKVVESLNRAADHMVARRMIEGGLSINPHQASDLSFDLKSLLAKPAV